MRRREIPGQTRFLTFSCYRRLKLFSNPRIAGVFADALAIGRRKFGFDLYAWVVMPEHVHLLLRPHDGVMAGRALRFIKKSVSERVIARWRALHAPILARVTTSDGRPRFWQPGGGFDRNVRDEGEFSRHVLYIHQNPVERGLVTRAEEWRWSSVRWWMGQRGNPREIEIECDPPPGKGWEAWRGFKEW